MEELVLAAVSSVSYPGRLEDNLSSMSSFIEKGASLGADIIAFPEMNLTGYCSGECIDEISVSLDGELEKRLCDISAEYKSSFICGLAERKDKKNYASHIYIKNGRLEGIYRKIQPGPPEIGYITPGDQLPLFSIKGWTFGIQLCFDSHFPEISTYMAKKGAELIIIPHASPRGDSADKLKSWERHLTARAFDNGLYIAALNQCGNNGRLSFPGISLMISPSGEIIDKELSDKESIKLFRLDKKQVTDTRSHRMKDFLRYRRNSFYDKILKNL